MPALVVARPGCCGLGPRPGPASSRRRLAPTCFAHTTSGQNHSASPAPMSYERVLRYPDGVVRRIRYPVPSADDTMPEASGDSWETLNVWKSVTAAAKPQRKAEQQQQQPQQQPGAGLPGEASTSGAQPAPLDVQQEGAQVGADRVPDSPLQLLRFLTSDAYKSSQRELERKVRESYEVLDGSPWVAPRPLYVLATQQPGRDAVLTFTLRTRVARGDVEDELSRVLRRRRPDGSPVIRCAEVKDGVVAFECEEAASRFADMLEEEGGHSEVAVAQCDSHALFRSVQGAAGVVVLLRPLAAEDDFLPQPHQLATALRGQRSMEDNPLGSVDED